MEVPLWAVSAFYRFYASVGHVHPFAHGPCLVDLVEQFLGQISDLLKKGPVGAGHDGGKGGELTRGQI